MRAIYAPLLVVIPLVAVAVFSEPDPSATHVDERPPNALERNVAKPLSPAYQFKEVLILPAPAPSERATYIEPTEVPVPTAVPTPMPLYVAPKLTPAVDSQRMREIVTAAGFPPETQDAALAVAWCESNYNESVVGAAGELGQFQIHPVHFAYLRETFGPAVDIASPEVNAWYAYQLSNGGTDWSHWSCKKVLR